MTRGLWSLFALGLVGCGRIHFDDLFDGGGGGGGGDGGAGIDGSATCAVAMCPEDTMIVDNTSMIGSNHPILLDHGLSGSCGGGGQAETTWEVTPFTNGTYTLTVTPGSVMYVREGCCGGPELACAGPGTPIILARTANARFVVIIEGAVSSSRDLTVSGS